jgi:hypothetical protein
MTPHVRAEKAPGRKDSGSRWAPHSTEAIPRATLVRLDAQEMELADRCARAIADLKDGTAHDRTATGRSSYWGHLYGKRCEIAFAKHVGIQYPSPNVYRGGDGGADFTIQPRMWWGIEPPEAFGPNAPELVTVDVKSTREPLYDRYQIFRHQWPMRSNILVQGQIPWKHAAKDPRVLLVGWIEVPMLQSYAAPGRHPEKPDWSEQLWYPASVLRPMNQGPWPPS